MKYLKRFNESDITYNDPNKPKIDRTKELSEEEFLNILKDKCKNFSFNNDLLWRAKTKKFDLELYTPNYRQASPLAFPKFFDEIEGHPDYPVIRKMSLIGGTDKEICKLLVSSGAYLVIPYDNSPIVFCPIVDLWALDDDRKSRRRSKGLVNGKPISKDNFIMVNYTKNFKVPMNELKNLRKARVSKGVEFFTSSPCLMVYESKIDWLKSKI